MDSPTSGLPSHEEFNDTYNGSMIRLIKRKPSQNINPNVRSSDDASETFSVLSYNIHSHLLVKNNYLDCTIKWLREELLKEITAFKADIICLQEVPRDLLENYFKPELKAKGYSGSVIRKKDNSKEADIDDSSGTCFTCFRDNLFKIIEESSKFEFGESQSSSVIRPPKVNLALILKLKYLRNVGTRSHGAYQPVICVANTCICSQAVDSNDPNKKLDQVSPLVLKLESCVQPQIPLLICGDLNFVPGSNAHEDPLRREEVLDSVLESAYASILTAEGIGKHQLNNKMDSENLEPSFTSKLCTVDYILYRVNTLKVVGLLEPPDKPSMPVGLALIERLSDHISRMAEFRFLPPLKQSYRDVVLKRMGVPVKRRNK